MISTIWKTGIWMALALMTVLTATVFGQTSASLSGEVQDAQGAAVPGAKVIANEITRNQPFETVTGTEGTFAFPTLQPGTYTLTVEAQGFKQLVKSGIVVNATDRQSAGTLALEPGEVTTTVEVVADAGQLALKTESGEQGETITGRQVRDLAVNGRNNLDLVKLVPGVVSFVNGQVAGPGGLGAININGTRGNQHNLTIDGTTNVDTGSNGTQHIALNLDTIAEFKVLTSNYQAEYGRSGGGDIKIVTRGGGSEFHGTGYYFRRHDSLNANTFFNNAEPGNPIPRSFYRYNYTGYNVNGPVFLPRFGEGGSTYTRLDNRVFFFFGQEFQRQLVPTNPRQVRVPTAAEVAGDFSNTRTGNGQLITVRDPVTGQPFPGNIIPANRLTASGAAILRRFNSAENSPGTLPQFNHVSQLSSTYPRRQDTIRLDYQVSDNTRIFGRYTRDADSQSLPYGLGWTSGQNFPLTPTIFQQPAKNATLNITSTLSPTMTNEFIFGPSQNKLSLDPADANAATFPGLGLTFQPPFPYPSDQFVNIEFQGIADIGNDNIGRINSYSQFPYRNSNTTFDFIDNVSKVFGSHTAKAGIFIQRSRKDQAAGDSARIIFSNDPNNPFNTGHPYANALLGNFNTYSQPTRPIYQGQYRYTNVEFFVQDNWKVNNRLTLDYGMRFAYYQPQFDQREQASFFNPSLYDPARAVRLYRRGTANNADYAFDPANPSAQLPSFLVGRIVPNSGDPFNGLGLSSNNYPRGGIESRGLQLGPTFGFAYDVFGNTKTVLRGGYRMGYDRVSGNNLIFPAVSNPPANINPTFNFGNLETVGASAGQVVLGTSNVVGADTIGKIPTVQSFSLQLQQEVGFDTVVSVAYVGTLSSHLTQLRNLNYIPYGATFLRENQDPSLFTGGVVPVVEPDLPEVYRQAGLNFSGRNALPRDFLRAYPGYGDIAYRENVGSSNYHSMQVSVQRRFTGGLTYGLAYTWSKAMGTANDDGNFTNPVDTRAYDYRRLDFDRTHVLAINYVYNLPRLTTRVSALDNVLGRGVFDNWEISGITQIGSGQPTEIGIGIPDVGNLQSRINGSYTEPVRALVVRDPQGGDRSREAYFDYTAFRLPDVGDFRPTPRTYMERPGYNVTDLSLFKNFPFGGEGGSRYLQLRGEFFNVFNQAQFDNINTGLTFNASTNFSNFTANQAASGTSLRNLRDVTGSPSPASGRLGRALGEVSGTPGFVSDRRIIQLAVKLYF